MDIILGLGFGDEGKGLVTSHICSRRKNPLVIRFNGGHQAGHTVVHDQKRHVFSSFGSGTLQNIPTYWSKYCTFYPTAFLNERAILEAKEIIPQIFVHPLSPVVTPYDVLANQIYAEISGHGSVGVGFGTTIKRHETLKIHAQDLRYYTIIKAKLKNVLDYYCTTFKYDPQLKKLIDIDLTNFLDDCNDALNYIDIEDDSLLIQDWDLVFEGAQGILLDQNFGFFPNVTPSNTTTQNALAILNNVHEGAVNVHYVTRSYQTRHGAGFMTNESPLILANNENETNIFHKYQGKFRTGKLDPTLIQYAIECDKNFHTADIKKHLIVTCMDQHEIDLDRDLLKHLNIEFDSIKISKGDSAKNIEVIKKFC